VLWYVEYTEQEEQEQKKLDHKEQPRGWVGKEKGYNVIQTMQ